MLDPARRAVAVAPPSLLPLAHDAGPGVREAMVFLTRRAVRGTPCRCCPCCGPGRRRRPPRRCGPGSPRRLVQDLMHGDSLHPDSVVRDAVRRLLATAEVVG
ncbi:hypothetical protein ACIG0D_04840 [Streptomyces sp. NPDC052773]|uniref:hypothetical protein n=1 Tax=Streptomyces sp. NPDC052773 TaxID=3365693 RepID=UPI0037D17518